MNLHRFACAAALAALFAGAAAAQDIDLQGSNELRWADGRESLGGQELTKRYLEDRLYLNLYYADIRLGTRFEMLQPSEFGETRVGSQTLDKRFIEYDDADANVHLRIGDFYTVWGRGLGLSLIEDVVQGFDSGLDGLHGRVSAGPFEVEALAGRSEAGQLGLVREAQVSAAQATYYSEFGVTAGLQGMIVTPVEDVPTYDENRTWTGLLAWDNPSFSLWTEYAYEDVTGVEDVHDAFYGSLSWFGSNLGVVVDYKRYRYYRFGGGLTGAGSRYARSVDILPFHSPPIVQREFTSALFSKHPHIVRFDDEVGVQAEITYTFAGSNNIILNVSESSSFIADDLFIPSLEEENSPYRQLFVEFNGYPNYDWYLQAWAGMDEDLTYKNEGTVRARTGWFRRSVLGGGSELQLADDWSVKGQLEAGVVNDVDLGETSLETLTLVGATWKQKYSLSIVLETAEDDPNQDKTSWLKAEFGAFVANRHELIVTVGEERGGLVCTSGKCRVVAPFEGAKVTLTSIF
ncbi:MAG: hypothetical protein MAG453_01924 [Calditrichaeota bacterium]|nr:hypothetical protein [Calditrichota bacterium]